MLTMRTKHLDSTPVAGCSMIINPPSSILAIGYFYQSYCADLFQMMSLELDWMCGTTIVHYNCPIGGHGDEVVKMILSVLISLLTDRSVL